MKRILALIHDAGGAELFASLLRREQGFAWSALTLAGAPAEAIFRRAGLGGLLHVCANQEDCAAVVDAACINTAQHGNSGFDAVLYNPGWGPFPQRLVERCVLGRTPCVAVLDSWSDYRERFGHPDRGWEHNLPDAVATCDDRALALARELGLPRLARLRNHHFESLLERIAARKEQAPAQGRDLLFLSQTTADPAMSANGHGRFVYAGALEEQVLQDLLAQGEAVCARYGVTGLRLRLHPSETACRHLDLLRASGLPFTVEQASQADLVDSILAAKAVVGINTMALFTAFLCGRPTASILPNPSLGRVLPLPPELLHASVAQWLRSPRETSTTNAAPLGTFPDAGLAALLNHLPPARSGADRALPRSGQ